MSLFSKILGSHNDKTLGKLEAVVKKINELEVKFKSFSDSQLKEKTAEFKERLKKNPKKEKEILDEIMPEAFALVREAAKRTLHQRHFDVQLLGGVVLHQGKIAEMKTGEGKTLLATLPIYLNALTGRGVHVVTVNDYLARRDANWMGPVYHFLGLSCACLNHEKSYIFEPKTAPDQNETTIEIENLKEVTRREAYLADVTYGTNTEFGFDYLRDNMAPNLEMMVQRELSFAIIDEIDSILIDEARTPLIVSAPDEDSTKMYEQFSRIVPQLKENTDYNLDEKMKTVTLTEEGVNRVEKILGLENIYQEGGIRYVHHLEQALRAEIVFKRDRDYVVKNGEVIIVDEFTGRLMPGRRYSEGLHQALEAKEKVQVQRESRTLASVTIQNYFRMYPKLAGMTGTAVTSAEEFHKVYNLDVVVIPTNKLMIRRDLPDSIYRTERGKFLAIVQEVKERHKTGQPVLIGTVSIEKNELLSKYLEKSGIPHQVLNAKNHEQEAQIIAQAGRYKAVTLATNMAGRGVDIVLGGQQVQSDEAGQPKEDVSSNWQKEHDQVVKLGGLHVIGTERHEARRIDDQLRGRTGRQGDPGSSQFFVSLEDDLMRIFGGDKIRNLMETLKVPEDQPIENSLVSKAIGSAQAKIEGYNFDTRNHVLEYDDVLNKQRETIYRKRKEILKRESVKEDVLEMVESEIGRVVNFHTKDQNKDKWNLKEIGEVVKSIFQTEEDIEKKAKELKTPEQITKYLIGLAHAAYEKKEEEIKSGFSQASTENTPTPGKSPMRQVEKFMMLRAVDSLWMDHLDTMDYLRSSVRLRAYGQKDPLVEYKNEGQRLFKKLLSAIQSTVVNMIYKVALAPRSQTESYGGKNTVASHGHLSASGHLPSSRRNNLNNSKKKVSRNAPCPCGSGKKYKRCCGR